MESKHRIYVYKVALAVVPLLTALGFMTEEIAGHVLNIIIAVLAVGSTGLALRNVSPEHPGLSDLQYEYLKEIGKE